MAYAVTRATLGQSLGGGRYNASAAGVGDQVTTLDTAITAAIAAAADVTADSTVAGDPTALGLAEASDEAIAAVAAQQAVVKTGDLVVFFNTSTITDRNSFRAAMTAVEQSVFGGALPA